MEQQVIISPVVISKLKKLELVLFKKEYFGFLDSAEEYVHKIFDTIYSIPTVKHHKTKTKKAGAFFVRHKPNSQTIYYITFDIKDNRYLVKDIFTNHEKRYKTWV